MVLDLEDTKTQRKNSILVAGGTPEKLSRH